MKKVKVAIVGCGLVLTAHAADYLEDERSEITAVCDILPEKLETAAREYGARKKVP